MKRLRRYVRDMLDPDEPRDNLNGPVSKDVPRTYSSSNSSPRGYEVLPGGRIARMSALEGFPGYDDQSSSRTRVPSRLPAAPNQTNAEPHVISESFRQSETVVPDRLQQNPRADVPLQHGRSLGLDVIRDARLDATFADGKIQHPLYTSAPSGGPTRERPLKGVQTWTRRKELGSGTFGTVWLEECSDGAQAGMLRAVKEVRKAPMRINGIDYGRELEAVLKFSHQKVCRKRTHTTPLTEHIYSRVGSMSIASQSRAGGSRMTMPSSSQWSTLNMGICNDTSEVHSLKRRRA
jgi:hypothetical protein